ncbi:MAG: methionine--tRNA ligase [Calditrichaeota bacterium]|nr:methionine--tRNA ligase [Calditrichota bacterium]MBT7788722.1 methionine--tRNA ligase [Calditrichota bacterium]
MQDQLYITTPLYYVNSEPHIGHAYTTILADVLCRYHKKFGRDVYFLSGLDEHGQKVADAAAREKVEPQEHCDLMSETWTKIWKKLSIEFDDFIRTTEPRHENVVTKVLQQLWEKGDIYKEEYEGWYSVFEERFFTEKDLVDGKDPIGGREVEKLKESNYFFKMSQYKDWLISHYEANPSAVVPEFRLNEVKGFLRQPLGDLCISRPKSRLDWGIPIPWDNEYVTYVWFDALLNYYSATLTPPAGKKVNWPATYHLIAKDILTTHAVYWPIMLHAAGLEPPKQILAHGYWLAKDSVKMSKSIGNVVRPLDMAEYFGTDGLRYVLMREMVLGQDASLSIDTLVNRINTELANDLGNLYSRLAKIWQTGGYAEAIPPTDAPEIIPEELQSLRSNLGARVREEIEKVRPHLAIETVMQVVRQMNRFIEHLKPWAVVKTDPQSIFEPITYLLDTLYEVACNLEPVMPGKMSDLKNWLKPDGKLIKPTAGNHLFPRIKVKAEDIQQGTDDKSEKPPKGKNNKTSGVKSEITIEDFTRLDLRSGTIISAAKIEDADKLLLVQVDMGFEKRQIVAGIAEAYSPEDLAGKNVVVVANLKPITLRGQLSQGMLLAVGKGKKLELVTFNSDIKPGGTVR